MRKIQDRLSEPDPPLLSQNSESQKLAPVEQTAPGNPLPVSSEEQPLLVADGSTSSVHVPMDEIRLLRGAGDCDNHTPSPVTERPSSSATRPGSNGDPLQSSASGAGHLEDKRPISDEHFAILELQALWAQKWDKPQPSGPPSADNLQRVLHALRSPRFGFDACTAAIHGHHKQASKEGSQLGREFRHIFPEARIGNNRHSCKLDEDRFEEFVSAGNGRNIGVQDFMQREKADRKRQERDDEEAKRFSELVGIDPKKDKPTEMLRKVLMKGNIT